MEIRGCRRGFELVESGEKIFFDKGRFDNWCVYVMGEDGNRCTPKDTEYFKELYDLGVIYGFKKVYDSFCRVYEAVKQNNWKNEDRDLCISVCSQVASDYGDKTLILWLTLFMTMLAEENKKNAILGKRIKRLGVYKILLLHEDIFTVAKGMVGKRWFVLDDEMKEYGI